MKELIFINLIIIFISCNSSNPIDKEATFRQTKAANDISLQGHIEKNAAKIYAIYSDNAILLPPGGVAPIQGKQAIQEYYNNSLKSPGSTLDITTENIHYEVIDENHAQEVGRYNIIYKADTAQVITEIKGYMLINWEKVNGEWKIKIDMWH
ncbi:MAG: nuclear transport factor 2 family protein [Saprospiraceae bacterium]|nr:nuclear transport factor 2 family protein [Saprospiraceae bacterium]